MQNKTKYLKPYRVGKWYGSRKITRMIYRDDNIYNNEFVCEYVTKNGHWHECSTTSMKRWFKKWKIKP